MPLLPLVVMRPRKHAVGRMVARVVPPAGKRAAARDERVLMNMRGSGGGGH